MKLIQAQGLARIDPDAMLRSGAMEGPYKAPHPIQHTPLWEVLGPLLAVAAIAALVGIAAVAMEYAKTIEAPTPKVGQRAQ